MNTTVTPPSASTSSSASASRNVAGQAVSAKEINDRFMTLLVAQMRNQDPMNPMDSNQMTSQLSQISTVSGIETLNQTVQSLVGQIASLQSMQATSMAGRDVLVTGNSLRVGADGIARGGIRLDRAASDVNVVVRDLSGQAVRTINLGASAAGVRNFEWDGRFDNGGRAGSGAGFTFAVEATQGAEVVPAEALARGRVEGVLRSGDAVQLNLGTLGNRALTDVVQVM